MSRSEASTALRALSGALLIGILALPATPASAGQTLALPDTVVRMKKGPYEVYARPGGKDRKALREKAPAKAIADVPWSPAPGAALEKARSLGRLPKSLCDECPSETIRCGATVTGALAAGDCDLGDGVFLDVWVLEVEGVAERQVRVDLGSATFDTLLIVTDASCEEEPLGVNDDCVGSDSCLILYLQPGSYYILVSSYWWGETGNYSLRAICTDPPPPLCATCEVEVVSCGETVTGTLESGDCDLGNGTFVDVWQLEVEGDEDRQVDIELTSDTLDTLLIVEDSACRLQDSLGINDDCVGLDSCLSLLLEPGTYFILADSLVPGAAGSYELTVSCGEPPPSICEGCLAGELLCGEPVTGELEAQDCDLGDGSLVDAWQLEIATTSHVSIDLSSESFDTFLILEDAVCNPDDAVAVNDDCVDFNSCFTGMLQAGTYFVLVTSFSFQTTGPYELSASCAPCLPPETAVSPFPEDGAESVPLDVTLSWGGQVDAGGALNRLPKTIYGADDRRDEFEVTDQETLAVGDATVALVSRDELTDNGDGTYTLPAMTLAEYYKHASARPLCLDEPYRLQPSAAFCSGFLVGPDLVATAGHCIIGGGECTSTAFVFGLVMLDPQTAVLTVDASQVYFCDHIVSQEIDLADWGLIRLDRPVPDHDPLPVRTSGRLTGSRGVFAVGHPLGLPRKYSGGASTRVRDNNPMDYFQANIDAFGGSSGSAVLDAGTFVVEGIIVRGYLDFIEDGACDRSLVCPDTGCPLWEECTRTTAFADFLPTFDVYLGTEPDSLELVAPRHATPSLELSSLEPETDYHWRVDARDECGTTEGAVWTFRTTFLGGGQVPGDCDQNGGIAITDAIRLLKFLFAGGVTNLPCTDDGELHAATYQVLDWDGDSDLLISDGILLLQWLFLHGPPHVLGTECTPIEGCPMVCTP